MIISVDSEKAFGKTWEYIMLKLQRDGDTEEYMNTK